MRQCHIIFLLALMCVATTISPAVADTEADEQALANLRKEQLRQGTAGVREEEALQIVQMTTDTNVWLYQWLTRQAPTSLEDMLTFGLLPLVPLNANGQPMEVAQLSEITDLAPGILYVRMRERDNQLLCLGADGDPLAPLIKSFGRTLSGGHSASQSLAWRDMQQQILSLAIREQLSVYWNVYREFPASWDAVRELVPLSALNHRTLPIDQQPEFGIVLSVGQNIPAIRLQRFPDPGYAATQCYSYREAGYALDRDSSPDILSQPYTVIYSVEILPTPTPTFDPMPTPDLIIWDHIRPEQMPGRELFFSDDISDALTFHPAGKSIPLTELREMLSFTPLTASGEVVPIIDDAHPELSAAASAGVLKEFFSLSKYPTGAVGFMASRPLPNGANALFVMDADRVQYNSIRFGIPPPAISPWPSTTLAVAALQQRIADYPGDFPEAEKDLLIRDFLYNDFSVATAQQIAASQRCMTLIGLAQNTSDGIPVNWNEYVATLRLRPRTFRFLDATEIANPDARTFEIAVHSDSPLYRIRVSVPGLPTGALYIAWRGMGYQRDHYSQRMEPRDFPGITQLPWRTVVRGEMLPIPEPPDVMVPSE